MKKALKITAKVLCIFFGTIIGFLALCCIVTLLWGAAQMSKGSVTESLPVVPENSKTDGFTVEKNILEKGKTYTLTITAESAYKYKSETVSINFTV